MPSSTRIALLVLTASFAVAADDKALWNEFGLQQTTSAKAGKLDVTIYRMKDLTGSVAAWEWQRSAQSHTCTASPFCSTDGKRTVISEENYLFSFDGLPTRPQFDALLKTLPERHDSSLPAVLTFVPRSNLVPNSARYVLGPASLAAFAPDLSAVKPGFEQGAEAQVADYQAKGTDQLHLALFYYPTPEMARIHSADFRALANTHVKRSGVLVAVIHGPATDQQAASLLSRIEYEAKIVLNEIPPPSPIKPLYQLLRNIIFFSAALSALCLAAGLVYAGLRIYRRRYGTLEDEEAMTTLHLTGK